MSAMAAASSLSKMDSTSGILRRTSSSVLWSGGGGECGGVGVDSSSGRWPGCCEGGGGGGGLCAGATVGVADILLAALECGEDAGAFAATCCRWLSDLSDVACGILDGDG